MQIAQVMSGYSLGEADLLRRAMGKKIASAMAEQKTRFLRGAVDQGIDADKAEEIFDLLAQFAAYGFNKSHSAAYGYVSYQTAYLKAHFRAEYMAALMSIESANTDKVLLYIGDCRRAGLSVLPVCLNESRRDFSVPPGVEVDGKPVIRFGLAAVKNVGEGSIRAILDARDEGGPFADALDVFERVPARALNKRVVENLVKAGAFDFTGVPRSALLESVDKALGEGQRRSRDKESGQIGLFGAAGPVAAAPRPVFRFPDIPEWPLPDKLEHERAVLGLYLSGHPMEAFQEDVRKLASFGVHELPTRAEDGDEVRLLGLPSDVKVIKTRRGDRMAFVTLDDHLATVECTFFSEPWSRSQQALRSGEPVLVTGRVERDASAVKVLAQTAEVLGDVRARTVRTVCLEVQADELSDARVRDLRALLEQERGPCSTQVVVHKAGAFDATFDLPDLPVRPSRRLEDGLLGLFGRPIASLR